eukprot:GFYU01015820.1.p1 GENE.GFYU01015820.1~~GFYU01015820.1.p1  ORF type:complete len:201 (-),score=31.00 GFYU01015820.1:114-716(-)
MFQSHKYIEKRTGKNALDRFEHLQQLVTEFQNTQDSLSQRQILANLGNFAYDPVNYAHLRKLNVIELFVDYLTEDDPVLKQFSLCGLCNCVCDPQNQQVIIDAEGLEDIMECCESDDVHIAIPALTCLYHMRCHAQVQHVLTRDKGPEFLDRLKKRIQSREHHADRDKDGLYTLMCLFVEDLAQQTLGPVPQTHAQSHPA